MINNKYLKKSSLILTIIIAAICVIISSDNVIAASVVRSEDIVVSLGDSNDTNINVPSNSTVIESSNGILNGTTCQYFEVTVKEFYSNTHKGESHYDVNSGNYFGPFMDNQRNIIYNVAGMDSDCVGKNFTAFCIDPDRHSKDRVLYYAESLNIKSRTGARWYALYQISKKYDLNIPLNYFAFNIAARIIEFMPDSDWSKQYVTSGGKSSAYYNNAAGLTGTAVSLGRSLASEAVGMADKYLKEFENEALGLRLSSSSGSTSVNGQDGTFVNVIVENCSSQTCVSQNDLTFNGLSVSPYGSAKYDDKSKTLTFPYIVYGASDSCESKKLEVTLKHGGENNPRNALVISQVNSGGNKNQLQNFLVFSDNNDVIKASINIGGCGENPPNANACKQEPNLVCGTNENGDSTFVVVNEGLNGGETTDWENCIIHNTDSQGNSYDVVDTSSLHYTSEDDEELDFGVIGYTSDGSEIKDADYCTISCKEKYAFIMPNNKNEVKQGTYFSFRVNGQSPYHAVVGVSAERLCASTAIKNTDFEKRAIDLRKQQMDYYNMYLYYKQIYNAMNSKEARRYYKSLAKNVEIKNDPTETIIKYEEKRDPSKETVLQKDKFRDNKWFDKWTGENSSGAKIKVRVKLYLLANPDSLEDDTLVPYEKEVELDKSFQEAFGTSVLHIKNGYDFYEKYYGTEGIDSKIREQRNKKNGSGENSKINYAIFDKKIEVPENFDKSTNDQEAEYIHSGYQNREEKKCTDSETNTAYPCGYEYGPRFEETKHYEVTYKENSRKCLENSECFEDDSVFDKYNEVLEKEIKYAYLQAKEKYTALNAQIDAQAVEIQECTKYLVNNDKPFMFNPQVTFSYPNQASYMQMLSPNLLENMNEGEIERKDETFFCDQDVGKAEEIFTCTGGEGTKLKFGYGKTYEDNDAGRKETVSAASEGLPELEMEEVEYYNATRAGLRSTYGRFSADGGSCGGSSYVNGNGSRGSYCYEFYQSAKQFYVQAPDGIVSTNPSGGNKTILDTDGRVYPVAINTPEGQYPFYVSFANIGQYNESTALGRLMGGGNGIDAVLEGELGDTEVCYYEVCRIDDPDCGKCIDCESDKCTDIIINECNNGNISDPLKFSNSDYEDCISKLLDYNKDDDGDGKPENCCEIVEGYKNIRQGKWEGMIPGNYFTKYQEKCNPANTCESFTIVSTEYYSEISNLTDLTTANNSGALQVNARTVSLNNLFPNQTTGSNWQTSEAKQAAVDIQDIGDGIFATASDYYVVMDAKCASAIRDYNHQQDNSGYNSGGFNDYTDDITDAMTENNLSLERKGSTAMMSEGFRELLQNNCGVNESTSPKLYNKDGINDGSRVTT